MRVKERSDKEEPKPAMSTKDKLEPKRSILRTDIAEPSCT